MYLTAQISGVSTVDVSTLLTVAMYTDVIRERVFFDNFPPGR